MFDDPNLHWRTYGFLNFSEIIKQAKLYNYHCSFATIPLDGWLVHRPTSNLFKKHSDRISLLIHGNNHTKQELASKCSKQECDQVLKQALHRIARLEQRSNLEVSKVLAPPHGACSELFFAGMARLGFEAACISHGSIFRYNRLCNWARTIGIRPIEIIEGLPVLPRFPFGGEYQNKILIAALLHQPIILVGHHHDAAEGLDFMKNSANFINSIGHVKWANMKQVARSQYARKLVENTLHVKMFSNRMEIKIPDGITHILIEPPKFVKKEAGPILWRPKNRYSNWKLRNYETPIAVLSSEIIEISNAPSIPPVIGEKDDFPIHLWPIMRRLPTEGRDRIAPLIKQAKDIVKFNPA